MFRERRSSLVRFGSIDRFHAGENGSIIIVFSIDLISESLFSLDFERAIRKRAG